MADLVSELKTLLGTVVVFRYQAHGYHWNVEGDDFHAFHDFFADIYADAEGSIDDIAESIRKLGERAPCSLSEFIALSDIKVDDDEESDPQELVSDLFEANKLVIASLYRCMKACQEQNAQGVFNLLAGRAEMHEKWNWQLQATMKKSSDEDAGGVKDFYRTGGIRRVR